MRSLLVTLTALAVSSCASVAPPGPSVVPAGAATGVAAAPAPAAPTAAEQKTATSSALAVERQWLASWFGKTPVVIGQRSDGAVTIDVPRAFCFDPGRSAVKPALAAVLDKLAESLRRVPAAQLPLLAAPDDNGGAGKLALQRAAEIRDHLRGRGIAIARLGEPAVTSTAAVQLRMEPGPSP